MSTGASSSSSFSSQSHQDPFHNKPQRFSKTRQASADVVSGIVNLLQKGPRTLLGTIVDTTYHVNQQYVTVTTNTGIVQVYGVPIGQAVAGMRLYCRQMGGPATTKRFVFDGFAPALSSLGPNGSLILTPPVGTLSAYCAYTLGMPASSSVTSAVGYYWHFFFYVPAVPTTNVTLFQFAQTGSLTTTLTVQLTPACILQVIGSDGKGYRTLFPVVPHSMHWVFIQPGKTGAKLCVDGIFNYTGMLSGSEDPGFAGGTNTYSVSLLSNVNGGQVAQAGSWISKFGYGTATGSPLPTLPVTTIPQQDSDLVNQNSGGIVTKALFLFDDTFGTNTASFTSSVTNTGQAISVNAPSSVVATGPY